MCSTSVVMPTYKVGASFSFRPVASFPNHLNASAVEKADHGRGLVLGEKCDFVTDKGPAST